MYMASLVMHVAFMVSGFWCKYVKGIDPDNNIIGKICVNDNGNDINNAFYRVNREIILVKKMKRSDIKKSYVMK